MEWLKDDFLSELNKLKLSLLSQGENFVDLFMINPDLPPARVIQDKLVEACIKPGNHRYAVSRGIRRLREAFALKFQTLFGVQLAADQDICVTMGTKDALPNALLCLKELGFGERVLLGCPTYPAHLAALGLAGMQSSFFSMDLNPQTMLVNFQKALDQSQARIALLNFPNNPTGICVERQFYCDLLSISQARGVFVINDFVYGEMRFDRKPAASILASAVDMQYVAESYSLSKAYNVAGWRIAALMGDSRLVCALAKLKSQLDYGIFLPLQFAACAALCSKIDLVSPTVDAYWRRFSLLSKGLKNLGWQVHGSAAGASLWACYPQELNSKIPAGSKSKSLALTMQLLTSSKVLAMPGILFGPEYDGYLRFALVVAEDQIRDVLERLEVFACNSQTQHEKLSAGA